MIVDIGPDGNVGLESLIDSNVQRRSVWLVFQGENTRTNKGCFMNVYQATQERLHNNKGMNYANTVY